MTEKKEITVEPEKELETAPAEPKRAKTFNPYAEAIQVHNGSYGYYENERRATLAGARFTKTQIDDIMAVVETIK